MLAVQPPLSLQMSKAVEAKLLETEQALRGAQQAILNSTRQLDAEDGTHGSPSRLQASTADGDIITEQQRTLLVIAAYKHSLENSEADLGNVHRQHESTVS
jgi:hypothetical protein